MNWFREHLKLGSRLALLALVLQLALSFGHFHAFAQAAPIPQASATKATAVGERPVLAQDTAAGTVRKQQPSDHNRDHPTGACAICAVMSLASSALLTATPILLLPQPGAFLHFATDAGILHLQAARTAFQSRAPPVC